MHLLSDRAECICVLLIWMVYIIALYLRYIICVQEFFSFLFLSVIGIREL